MADDLSSDLASLRIQHDADAPRGNKARILLTILVLGGLAAAAYFVLYPKIRARMFKTEVSAAEITLVSPAHSSIELTSTGYVMPQIVSQVAAKVPGRVAEVRVKQGQDIKQGDVLLVLDTVDSDAAIAAARTRVATSVANAETARANLAEIQQQLQRETEMVGQGVSPKATAEDLARRADALRAAVKAADAATRAAQAEVKTLEINLTNYTLTAPISGRILNKPPELGELVGPAMTGIASQVGGIEIADFSSLAVETDVPEARLGLVQAGAPCEIVLDAFATRRFAGEVYEVVPRVNRAKATVVVKVKFTEDNTGVLPDMSARVSFLSEKLDEKLKKQPPVLVVPSSAVTERAGAKVVFVIDEGKVRMTPVDVGDAFGEAGFVLKTALDPGTKVVDSPGASMTDGEKVKERTDG